MIKIESLKKPQKQKYRVFAWKTKEKPFECWDTDELDEAIHKAGDFFEDKRELENLAPKQEWRNKLIRLTV